ncbi:MAG: 50S ribosomal protein L10 [Christensenellales bacterium]
MSAETLKLKQELVAGYVDKIGKAKSFVLVDYRGLNVAEDTAMRNDLRKANVEYKVIKNRLVLRALNEAGIEGFDAALEGPTAMAISYDDAVAPAKIIVDNVKKTNKIQVKGGVVEGKKLDAAGITSVAAIPANPFSSLNFSVCCRPPFAVLPLLFPKSQRSRRNRTKQISKFYYFNSRRLEKWLIWLNC